MLTAGTRLGPYEIVAPLGAGGMGEVYRGRDTRLDRLVAIKILPEALAADPQFRERFDREARAISQLTHPNICTLYDVGDHDGTAFLVMELLEGETLAERLQKGALPLLQALTVAIEVASALDAAHRAGIVHRDLKPGNVMLTKSGAKLLDFGLAKTNAAVATGSGTMAATTPPNITAQGMILGTFQYMAPEQIDGLEADARTDIFAFGCVLFEMLTGKTAFEGKTRASLLGAIMHAEPPPVSHVQPVAPASLNRIVATCLAKDPDARWQSVVDLRRELQWIKAAGPDADTATTAAGRRALPGWRLATAAVLFAGVAAVMTGAAVWSIRPSSATAVSRTAVALTLDNHITDGADAAPVALSRDGSQLAFKAGGQLYLRSLDSFEAKPIPGTVGASAPFFSPDGHWLGFFANSKLQKVSIHGGAPVALYETVGGPNFATWGSGGVIMFSPAGGSRGLLRVPDSGGVAQPVITPGGTKDVAYRWPEIMPDGNAVVFTAISGTGSAIVAHMLKTGERRILIPGGADARYVSSGYLVYMNAGSLMAVPFDSRRLQVAGAPIPVVQGIAYTESGAGLFSVSANGSLVYVKGGLEQRTRRFVWVDRTGRAEPLAAPPRDYSQFSLSPDGGRIAVLLPTGTRNDIWTYDVARNSFTRLTFDSNNSFPIWTPDGKRVTYQSNKGGSPSVFQKPADGNGPEEPLPLSENTFPNAWSPDGKELVFNRNVSGNSTDLWVRPAEGFSKARPFLQTPATEQQARVSRNGRWIAYLLPQSGEDDGGRRHNRADLFRRHATPLVRQAVCGADHPHGNLRHQSGRPTIPAARACRGQPASH